MDGLRGIWEVRRVAGPVSPLAATLNCIVLPHHRVGALVDSPVVAPGRCGCGLWPWGAKSAQGEMVVIVSCATRVIVPVPDMGRGGFVDMPRPCLDA